MHGNLPSTGKTRTAILILPEGQPFSLHPRHQGERKCPGIQDSDREGEKKAKPINSKEEHEEETRVPAEETGATTEK